MDYKTIFIGMLLFSAVMLGANFLVNHADAIKPKPDTFNFMDMRPTSPSGWR